jgi:hypothetical protein
MPSKRQLLLQRCFARCGGGNATSWEYSDIDVIVVDIGLFVGCTQCEVLGGLW